MPGVTAANWKIEIRQGATWAPVLTVSDDGTTADLTGYTAWMQIRESVDSPDILHELTMTSGITIDGPAGKISLRIPSTVTATWTWRSGVYDMLLISPGGDTEPFLEGEVLVDRAVTR
jgi:hypothetical protein